MSSCKCGSNCSCDSCSCGSNMYPTFASFEKSTSETLVLGPAPLKMSFEGSDEMSLKEDGGCKCGSSCSCDPCNC